MNDMVLLAMLYCNPFCINATEYVGLLVMHLVIHQRVFHVT